MSWRALHLSLPPPELQPTPVSPTEADVAAKLDHSQVSLEGDVEYTGIPRRPKPPLPDISQLSEFHKIQAHLEGTAPTDSASWSTFARASALRAQRAARSAKRWRAAAGRHADIARASAEQARMALLEEEAVSRVVRPDDPAVQPLVRLCGQLSAYCRAHPGHSEGRAVLQLRRFCAGLELQLGHTAKVLPGRTSEGRGPHLYDQPPASYPTKPPWLPASPQLLAPGDEAGQLPEAQAIGSSGLGSERALAGSLSLRRAAICDSLDGAALVETLRAGRRQAKAQGRCFL